MSIYVTITRNPNPFWKGGERIAEADWRRVALADAGFRVPTEAELRNGAPWVRPGDLVWAGHAEYPEVWFSWSKGQIDVKNPDECIIAKMMTLAARLGARVISEQGESFDANGNSLGLSDLPDEPGTA
jgi:hypothetical protein